MNESSKTALIVVLSIVVILLLLFGGGMMGNGAMGGVGWMWIPAVLMTGLGALLVWIVFGQKK